MCKGSLKPIIVKSILSCEVKACSDSGRISVGVDFLCRVTGSSLDLSSGIFPEALIHKLL